MSRLIRFLRAVTNRHNLRVAWRMFRVVKNPLTYLRFLASGRGSPTILARAPIGEVAIRLRNHEAARTFFSIFVRQDYPLKGDRACGVLDVGSNIGISALYFLSRHRDNRVFCVEPDPANAPFLVENLAPHAERATIVREACSAGETGELDFHVSPDGKYSSLLPNERATEMIRVAVRPLLELVEAATPHLGPNTLIMKIDIEGLEKRVLLSLPGEKLAQFQTIFVEALGVGAALGPGWDTQVLAGYVEMIERTDRQGFAQSSSG